MNEIDDARPVERGWRVTTRLTRAMKRIRGGAAFAFCLALTLKRDGTANTGASQRVPVDPQKVYRIRLRAYADSKTVTTIGLTQGLQFIGKQPICCIRQPSMGPVFGIKGGAAGGG